MNKGIGIFLTLGAEESINNTAHSSCLPEIDVKKGVYAAVKRPVRQLFPALAVELDLL